MRRKLFEIIEVAKDKQSISAAYDMAMMAIIVISLIPLVFKETTAALSFIDKATACVFIADYAVLHRPGFWMEAV